MTGQASGDRVPVYKLNEIRMSGDTGAFSLVKLLEEKGEDGRYQTMEIGGVLQGVILKMRWKLSRYDEQPDGSGKFTSTSEFDNKNTDKIVVLGSNEKGLAFDIKEKYNLGSQRVLYVYVPAIKEIVRVIVKASALSGDKNPAGELGLFEYVDQFNAQDDFLHEYLTIFGSVHRKDPKGNKRKDYDAMTFTRGEKLTDAAQEKVIEMIKEVHEKTTKTPFADDYAPTVVGSDNTPEANKQWDEMTGEVEPDIEPAF